MEMKPLSRILLFIVLLLIIQSCQIDRRHYMTGFFANTAIRTDREVRSGENVLTQITLVGSPGEPESMRNSNTMEIKCDTLYLVNGEKIPAQIVYSDSSEIKYMSCKETSKVIHSIKQNKVLRIAGQNHDIEGKTSETETVLPKEYAGEKKVEIFGLLSIFADLISIASFFWFSAMPGSQCHL